MRAIADTGPLHYLALAGHIQILPALFSDIAIPDAVLDELAHPDGPIAVRDWIAARSAWLLVNSVMPAMLARVDAAFWDWSLNHCCDWLRQ